MLITKQNCVVQGDTYDTIREIPSESINLCYLDPPFFAKRTFEVETSDSKFYSFDDKWDNDIEKYLGYMKNVFAECHRILASTGSLYLHCDWHASHYLKIELDKIFGYDNFRNEIIWRRHNAHNDTKQGCKLFGRIHDTILFYSKSKNYTWNPIYEPYPQKYVDKYYKHIEPETGRRYARGDLSGPGGRSKGNPRYEFLGVTRYWRFSKEKMEQLYKDGRIIQTKRGNVPVVKRYLNEMPGITLQDIWDDIQSPQLNKSESVSYPTQKPQKLLERIIEISTNPKDVVLDPFCGSGTTLVSAKKLNRNFIGVEINPSACKIARTRLQEDTIPKLALQISSRK